MVMITRSAFKRSSETWNSDISEKNIIPPWCSSVALLLSPNNPKAYFISFSKSKSLLPTSSVTEVCCDRMHLLTLQLNRAERALRNTMRFRKAMWMSQNNREPPMQRGYIAGAKAIKGSTTTEWGGNVALWGIVPLWRASPPPDTVLAVRSPTPADCWAFRGSYGEIIIQLPRRSLVETVSVEHVRPDTTRSAPKHFTLFGILENGTWIKSADGEYTYNKAAKQYFSLATKNFLLKQVVFRVSSNQGNKKYTCIYRVHLYSNN